MDAQVSRLFEPSNYGELAETVSGLYFIPDLLTAILRHHSSHPVFISDFSYIRFFPAEHIPK